MSAPGGPAPAGHVAVVGAGLGGIAAALAAADAGAVVTLTGEDAVVGGQVTAQATSPLDEHPLIETTGAPGSYQEFRRRVRARLGGRENPGGGWVSRLCFEPAVGQAVLEDMLAPHVAAGRVRLELRRRPTAVRHDGGRVLAVELAGPGGVLSVVEADVFVDATELGDLLALAGAPTVVGSEGSDAFGEPHAVPGGPDPRAEQSCTWVAGLRLDPAAGPTAGPVGPPPARYRELARSQPFTLDLDAWDGSVHRYAVFADGPDGAPPFWTYRRVRDAAQLGGRDAAVLNWAGNDYAATGLVHDPERTRRGARELTLAFVHWLRTEAPRDDGRHGGRGHPEIQLAPEVTGTGDGLARAPYVRESRRLASSRPVTEHDLAPRPGSERATGVPDAVGTAWYHADLHPRVGRPGSVYAPTAPFQVPARALVPEPGSPAPVNLLAGAKNLAATQVAAAAYRVHPGEWSVGEAAGVVAALAAARGVAPRALVRGPGLRAVQERLLGRGTPLVWARDLPAEHPALKAATFAVLAGGLVGARAESLDLRPDEPLDEAERAALARALGSPRRPSGRTWAEAATSAASDAGTGPRTGSGTGPDLLPTPAPRQEHR